VVWNAASVGFEGISKALRRPGTAELESHMGPGREDRASRLDKLSTPRYVQDIYINPCKMHRGFKISFEENSTI